MTKQNETTPESIKPYCIDATPKHVIERYAKLLEIASTSDFGLLDEDCVVIDTETTGVSYKADELTQIAAARLRKGEIVDWFITFVNPGKPIPEEVAHLTNIHDEDVADAPTPAEALRKLADFVGESYLVAHNADFDFHFCTNHPEGEPLRKNVWVDSLDLTRIALPRLRSHRLIDLVHAFNAPISTHRADDDVRALCAVYRILLAAIKAMPLNLHAYISQMASLDEWGSGFVFKELIKLRVNNERKFATLPPVQGEDLEREIRTFASSLSLKSMRAKNLALRKAETKHNSRRIAFEDDRTIEGPSEAEIDQAFSAEGLVGSLYDNYEVRAEQRAMARGVARAYSNAENLMVEAGTGVGKSMAYLVPSALLARKNNITVGVATKTNALLDQLVHKELPLLSEAFEQTEGRPLIYSPLKGYVHYACLRKVQSLMARGPRMVNVFGKEVSQAPALAGLLSFIEQTIYDDIDALKIDYRSLPKSAITTTSQECLKTKCPFYSSGCFVHGARRAADTADIVVTNHSLMFMDSASDNALLPPIQHWVIDEAHGAEAEARSAFLLEVSSEKIISLRRTISPDSEYNIFRRIEQKAALAGENHTVVVSQIGQALRAAQSVDLELSNFLDHFKDLLQIETSSRSKGYESYELWINKDVRENAHFIGLAKIASHIFDEIDRILKPISIIIAALEDVPELGVLQRELATTVFDLKSLAKSLDVIFLNPTSEYAYSAQLWKKLDRRQDSVSALLLNVGPTLNDMLYRPARSIIFASATLAVGDSFGLVEKALGLNQSEESECRTLQLASCYDYDKNMKVFVVNDMPEPNDPKFTSELQELLARIHIANHGSLLTLFTNRKEMENCFKYVQPRIQEENLRLVCQKWGVSVKNLRDDFVKDHALSLFALKSFWEGFDAPGDTLRGVVIPRLPFAKPTDPLYCERALRDSSAWSTYVLPQSVIEIKQAAGRLIRTATDSGVLIFADPRLITKGYGQKFLRSLPSKNITVLGKDELVEELYHLAQETN